VPLNLRYYIKERDSQKRTLLYPGVGTQKGVIVKRVTVSRNTENATKVESNERVSASERDVNNCKPDSEQVDIKMEEDKVDVEMIPEDNLDLLKDVKMEDIENKSP